jgi:DNA repair protein RecN (Recombination protein N)
MPHCALNWAGANAFKYCRVSVQDPPQASLNSLFVRDFAIVRRLELEFGPGLTVLTGETGAGKSILIDALALALGTRAETGNIRHGAENAEILAGFNLQPEDDALQWLREQDLNDDSACITRRIIYRDKPTRAFINDRPVTVQTLRELGSMLVDIHGQHEHQSLMRRETQRRVLDDYAGISAKVRQVSELYERHQALQSNFDSLSQQTGERSAHVDLLQYQINELEALAVSDEEYFGLELEQRRLAHANELIEGMHFVIQSLYEAEDNAINQTLAQCIQRVEVLSEFAPEFGEVRSLLGEALVQVEEAAGRLSQKLDKIELDPQRLQWVEQRIQAILDLARKHHCEPEALPQCLHSLQMELSDITNTDTSLADLGQQISLTEKHYKALAGEISTARKDAGIRLSREITGQMQELGMASGQFQVKIESMSGELTRYGLDRIEFQVSANRGQPLRPISRVASGGELSRIGLAIQVVTASEGHVPCLIFDEVDVGIGGGIAEIVGHKLRILGQTCQVLCITHLAQVASQGFAHLRINKQEDDGVCVDIRSLDPLSRVDEIARMLGGIEITDQTRAHARDMLERAVE